MLAWVLMAAVQDAPAESGIERWVERLGSIRPEEREAAQRELIELGAAVLESLEAHLPHRDPEVDARLRHVAAVIRRLAGRARYLPDEIRITLPQGRYDLGSVLATIEEQSGLQVRLYAASYSEAVDVGFDETPIMAALDGVCAALGRGQVWPAEGGLGLYCELPRPLAVSHYAQFRAVVLDVRMNQTASLRGTVQAASMEIRFDGQPGMSQVLVRGPWIDELVDDQGRDLRVPARESAPPVPGDDPDLVWPGGGGGRPEPRDASVHFHCPLSDARRIARARLRYYVTVPYDEISRTLSRAEVDEHPVLEIGGELFRITGFDGEHGLRWEREGDPNSAFHCAILSGTEQVWPDPAGPVECGNGAESAFYSACNAMTHVRIEARIGRTIIEVPVEFRDIPLPGREP